MLKKAILFLLAFWPLAALAGISNPRVTATGSNSITVAWDSTATEKSDRVYYAPQIVGVCPSNLSNVQTFVTSCDTSHEVTLTGLAPHTTYCLRVAGILCSMSTQDNSAAVITGSTDNTTATVTVTPTITKTQTRTFTITRTFTRTKTFTFSPTLTPTFSVSQSFTPSFTRTATKTATKTITWTVTVTPTVSPTPTVTLTETTVPSTTSNGYAEAEIDFDNTDSGSVGVHDMRWAGANTTPIPAGAKVMLAACYVEENLGSDTNSAKLSIGNNLGEQWIHASQSLTSLNLELSCQGCGSPDKPWTASSPSYQTLTYSITGEPVRSGKVRVVLPWYLPLH